MKIQYDFVPGKGKAIPAAVQLARAEFLASFAGENVKVKKLFEMPFFNLFERLNINDEVQKFQALSKFIGCIEPERLNILFLNLKNDRDFETVVKPVFSNVLTMLHSDEGHRWSKENEDGKEIAKLIRHVEYNMDVKPAREKPMSVAQAVEVGEEAKSVAKPAVTAPKDEYDLIDFLEAEANKAELYQSVSAPYKELGSDEWHKVGMADTNLDVPMIELADLSSSPKKPTVSTPLVSVSIFGGHAGSPSRKHSEEQHSATNPQAPATPRYGSLSE